MFSLPLYRKIIPIAVLLAILTGLVIGNSTLPGSPRRFVLKVAGLIPLIFVFHYMVTRQLELGVRIGLAGAVILGVLSPRYSYYLPIGLEDLFLVPLAIVLFFRLPQAQKMKRFHGAFAGIIFAILVSILWSSLILGEEVVSLDFLPVYRTFRWWAVWQIAFSMEQRHPSTGLAIFFGALGVVIIVELVMVLAQSQRWPGMFDLLLKYYHPWYRHSIQGYSERPQGSFHGTNYLGTFGALALPLFYLRGTQIRKVTGRWLAWILGVVAAYIIVMTASRASLLVGVGTLGLVVLVDLSKPQKWSHLIWIGLLMVGLIFGYFSEWSRSIDLLAYQEDIVMLKRFAQLDEGASGVTRRLDDLNRAVADWAESPLFGHGPSSQELSSVDTLLHGVWGGLLRAYGLMGVILYLLLLGLAFSSAWRLLRHPAAGLHTYNIWLAGSTWVCLTVILLTSWSYAALYAPQLDVLLWSLVGLTSGRLVYLQQSASFTGRPADKIHVGPTPSLGPVS
jgi:hypothetical protein